MDELAQWLNAHPLVKTGLMVAAAGCIWDLIRYMKERDKRLLSERRTSQDKRASERIAAIAQRVSELGGAGRTPKQGVPDNGTNSGQVGRGGDGAEH
jgi:hypothetical protein